MVSSNFIIGIIVGVSVVTGFTLMVIPAESGIPPTPAFSKVSSDGDMIEAPTFDAEFMITLNGDLCGTINGNELNIKICEKNCGLLESVMGVDEDGKLVCGIP